MKDHWEDGPGGFYHRECYQKYTNISYFAKTMASWIPLENFNNSVTLGPSPPKRLGSNSEFNICKCVICQKEKIDKSRKPAAARTR